MYPYMLDSNGIPLYYDKSMHEEFYSWPSLEHAFMSNFIGKKLKEIYKECS